MNKIGKIILSLFMAMILVFDIANISIKADTIYDETAKIKLTWNNTNVSVINMSQTSRMVSLSVNIYNKYTGQYVTQIKDECVLSYGDMISVNISNFNSSTYSYTICAYVYCSTSLKSPICWSITREIT